MPVLLAIHCLLTGIVRPCSGRMAVLLPLVLLAVVLDSAATLVGGSLALPVDAASAAQLTATWTDNSDGTATFKIERKSGTAGSYAQIGTAAAGVTTYVDASVAAGTTYCYRVKASNAAGDSGYSNEACASVASGFDVTVAKSGTGTGTVVSSPAGINCGTDCGESFAAGTVVTLTATPANGSTFSGWSGGGCTGTSSCVTSGNVPVTITATFSTSTSSPTSYTLAVTKAGTGTGTVVSSPAGINCGSDCSQSVPAGTTVTLTATPASGSTFAGWSGGGCGGTGTCGVTVNGATSVTATFTAATTTAGRYTLRVGKAGAGSGTVVSSPSGISCGTDCQQDYAKGTRVRLTAVADSGSRFTGWTGDRACRDGVVRMSRDYDCTATFAAESASGPTSPTTGDLECPCSIWGGTATTPAIVGYPDANAVELGVKFRASVDGYITAIRFYKASTNTGTHVGNLWTSGGQLLARVTFTSETVSGWQEARFSTPVPIAANTTYVASYYTAVGRYSVDTGYFATRSVDAGPLQAPSSSMVAGNGVFRYASTSTFPNQTYNANNYWVDVVFHPR